MPRYDQEYMDKLRDLMPEGSTVWTVLRYVNRDGTARDISPVVLRSTPYGIEPFDVTPLVIRAGILRGSKLRDGDGLRVSGGGMDMGHHVVDVLSYALYGKPYALNHRWL